jgi:DNA polymerase epsilon subunit 2
VTSIPPTLTLSKGPSEGLFTEGCFVLVEGDYNDEEVLEVIAIGHPPSERRIAAR